MSDVDAKYHLYLHRFAYTYGERWLYLKAVGHESEGVCPRIGAMSSSCVVGGGFATSDGGVLVVLRFAFGAMRVSHTSYRGFIYIMRTGAALWCPTGARMPRTPCRRIWCARLRSDWCAMRVSMSVAHAHGFVREHRLRMGNRCHLVGADVAGIFRAQARWTAGHRMRGCQRAHVQAAGRA